MSILGGCHLCSKCVFLLLLILCLVRKGDSNLDECCSYLTQAAKQPEQVRKGAEACCPYLAGGFNQFNLQTLKQNCTYFNSLRKNISKIISSNEPKILITNSISSPVNNHRSFFCYSKVNPDHLEFSTLDGKSYKELNDSWKNVYTYQLSCGILLTFSPIESCQYNATFNCIAKSNDTHPLEKQARINVLSFKILSFNQSYDSVHKGTAKNITCKLEISIQQVKVPSLEIAFQRYNKMSGEYISIKSSETFLLNPTESQINRIDQKAIVYLQRSLTISSSQYVKDAIVCVLLDKACGVVKHFLQEEEMSFRSLNREPPIYDAFISYSSKNREWVKDTLLCELDSRNIKYCLDFRDFMPGEYIAKNISDGIHSSRKTIAVLSTDYFESEYCKGELQTALHSQGVICISIDMCAIPDSLKKKVLKWKDNDKFWRNFVSAIRS